MLLATTTPIQDVVTSMNTQFTTDVADIVSGIGTLVPTLLPIVGVIAVIFIGIKLFKRVAK